MERITSVKNASVKLLRDLKDAKTRKETGLFLVEGEVMIREALKCGLKIDTVAADEQNEISASEFEKCAGRVLIVNRSMLEAICNTKTPQGICASFYMPEAVSTGCLGNRIVALDGVQDPGNVGTIWRTADAAGFTGILLGNGCPDPLSPKVQRASMGSGFRVPFSSTDSISGIFRELQGEGYSIVVSELSGKPFYETRFDMEKIVLVIGNEAHGVSDTVKEMADIRVKLPMRGGAESLNAAVAAGIMMYEIMHNVE